MKTVNVTKEEVETLDKMVGALFMQRATVDQEEGTDATILNEGEAVLRKMKESVEDEPAENLPCGCSKANRSLCPHGNSDLA